MLLLGVGVAIDYSSMVSKRSQMQDVADAVVIAAVTSGHKTEQDIRDFSNQYLADLGFSDVQLDIELTANNTVVISSKQQHEMFIMGAFGHDNQQVFASAEAPLPGTTLANLTLVLDTTESMSGARMTALKSATQSLLEGLGASNSGGQENVQVSLVPFSDYVRIEETNRNQNWLELQPDQDVAWQVLDTESSTNCREEGEGELRETVCDNYVYEERSQHFVWEGCMASRPNGNHKVPEFFGGNRLQGYVAHGHCNKLYSTIVPLTYDLENLNTAVQDLNTVGRTYIPVGLIWGWRTLDGRAPFAHDSQASADDIQDVMLVMTDGGNTVSLAGTKPGFDGIYHWGDEDDPAQAKADADQLTTELCTAIKQSGIRILTVAFEVEEDSTKNLLQNCASASSDFYDATNADELKQVFTAIGSGLGNVRLIR